MKDTIDVVISWDTTGSMYPAITQVRREVVNMVNDLFDTIPNIRIGCMAHGDYCDGPKNMLRVLDLTTQQDAVCKFVLTAPNTDGGDGPECYEHVLHQARSLSWTSGRNKAFVMIGDAVPHTPGYTWGSHTNELDWRNEAGLLRESGVYIYAVQALGSPYAARDFWDKLGDVKLDLDQFGDIVSLLRGICYKQAGRLGLLEEELQTQLRESPRLVNLFNVLAGRRHRLEKYSREDFTAVHPARFQILRVDQDCSIKDFVEDNGLRFAKGRGFYEFTRSVKVQAYKEVVIEDRRTGQMFSGERARQLLGIPVGHDAQVKPERLGQYRGFIQSTSNNRKLLAGTRFLYEVEGFAS